MLNFLFQYALTEAGLMKLPTITKLIIKLSATLVGSQLQQAQLEPHEKIQTCLKDKIFVKYFF